MGVLAGRITKQEGFVTRLIRKFIDGFMDFADKGFWYIGR
jgi:hypothetical protein